MWYDASNNRCTRHDWGIREIGVMLFLSFVSAAVQTAMVAFDHYVGFPAWFLDLFR